MFKNSKQIDLDEGQILNSS